MKLKISNEIELFLDLSKLELSNSKCETDKMRHPIINAETLALMPKRCFIGFDNDVRMDLIRFLTNPEKYKNRAEIYTDVLKVTKKSVKIRFFCVFFPNAVYVPALE